MARKYKKKYKGRSYRKKRYKKRIPRALMRTGGFKLGELKFHDTGISNVPIPLAISTMAGYMMDPATELCLNGIATGTTQDTRIGRLITARRLNIKGNIRVIPSVLAASLPALAPMVRLMVICDKQTNKTQMASENILRAVPSGSVNFFMEAFRDLQYTKRFQILFDRVYNFNYSSAGGGATSLTAGPMVRQFSINVNMNRVLYYDLTGNTVGNVTGVSFHVLAYSNVGGLDPGPPATSVFLNYNSRLRYTDQ